MATINSSPIALPKASQDGLIAFFREAYNLYSNQFSLRSHMEKIDLAYIRETDLTNENQRAKISNIYGDSDKFQNVTMPIVMPQVETAVTYQSSVFLTGYPIFGVVGNPKQMDAAMQMETVIEDQSIRGGWVRHLQLVFRDGFKYNLGAAEVPWTQDVTYSIETDVSYDVKEGRPKEIIWSGNAIKRIDPYNLIFDTRVALPDVPRIGEFAGYTEKMSRTALKDFINRLPDKIVENIKPAFESTLDEERYYVPLLNSNVLVDNNSNSTTNTNWSSWFDASGAVSSIKYHNSYEVTTFYARIIPSDFKIRVPSPNTPQVWKLIIVNGQVVILAERQTNAHSLLPILFIQPHERGLMYQDKSLASDVEPIQYLTSALTNSVIAARRRAVGDRALYDPSKISPKDMNSPNPSGKIPCKPGAYGKPMSDAVFPFPFRDDQSGVILQELPFFSSLAEQISGYNQAQQGRFVKGNKTREEFNTIMGAADAKPQAISLLLEAQFFTPLKEIIKLNILQYQGGVSLFNRSLQQQVEIDPVALRQSVIEFKVSDGLLPESKIIDGDAWSVAMQVVGSTDALQRKYDFASLFSYLMKTKGANISDFELPKEQVAYEQALSVWQQMKTLSIEKGVPFNDPQPKPADYGYNPTPPAAAPTTPSPQEQQQ